MSVWQVEGPARRRRRSRALSDGSLVLLLAVSLALCFSAGPVGATGGARAHHAAPPLGARAAVQQGMLTASSPQQGDLFGYAVAISGDTAVAGALGHDIGAVEGAGAAYVFTRSAGVWAQQAKLTAGGGGQGDEFGKSVAVSGDTIVVGAPHHAFGGVECGAAYVFTRSGGVWSRKAELIAPVRAAGDGFGASVAVSGTTILVGAPHRAVSGKVGAGAVYVFSYSAGSWTLQGTLTLGFVAVAGDQFGDSVAIWGETVVVGSPGDDEPGKGNCGAAYTFSRAAGVWSPGTRLIAADGAASDGFGAAVALCGTTALVGAPSHGVDPLWSGAAYVFADDDGGWRQQAKLIASDGAPTAYFGSSVALSGPTALVGAPYHEAGRRLGAAYVFMLLRGDWKEREQILSPPGVHGEFAGSVAVSGSTAVGGAPLASASGVAGAGAAYPFLVKPGVSGISPASGPVGASVTITGAGFTGATSVTFAFLPATFVVDSDETITATVPAGQASGDVVVHTPGGLALAPVRFTVIPGPVVASFLPASGPVGTPVTLTGTGFTDATAVAFAGTAAAFVVDSDLQISTTVPAGAATGPIAVTTPGGVGATATDFTVTVPTPVPGITRLRPASGKRRAKVTITGAGFGATRSGATVKFGSRTCGTYLSWSDTRIKCKVPRKAKYGRVRVTVTTAGGVSNAKNFRVKR